jgi:hypothetical protein
MIADFRLTIGDRSKHSLKSGGAVAIGLDYRVNQDVYMDCPHGSPPVHKFEQGIAVRQINFRECGGLPCAETQLIRRAGRRFQFPSQEVVGNRPESSPLFRRFFLQNAEKSIVNREGGSSHVQKPTADTSTWQHAAFPHVSFYSSGC